MDSKGSRPGRKQHTLLVCIAVLLAANLFRPLWPPKAALAGSSEVKYYHIAEFMNGDEYFAKMRVDMQSLNKFMAENGYRIVGYSVTIDSRGGPNFLEHHFVLQR